MQRDIIAEWQSLTQLYREMSDQELFELDAGIGDLTEVAQQVLRDEMRNRGLKRPSVAAKPVFIAPSANDLWEQDGNGSASGEDESENDGQPREYTWKTLLCECNDKDEVWQLREALRQAGIESWVDAAGYRVAADFGNPRVLVAADQLEEAREVASRPIPQAIVEQSRMQIPEFELPRCPGCGAEDPLLESADPVNAWLCESCGRQWTDPA
jgi:hypothetical protein